jgi:hypothetical protein
MILGRNLIVALDGVAVAAAKTCSLDMDQSFLEACSPVSGRTHTKIPTTYDWGVSVDGLVANNSSPTVNLEDKLIAGTKCLLTFTDGSGNRRAGFVYVKSCKESGPVGGLATYSASFESTGPLYKYQELSFGTIQGGDTFAIRVVDGEITYDFQASGTETLGLQVTPSTKSVLFVNISEDWAVFKNTLAQIEVFIQQGHDDYLNESLVTCGWRNSKAIPLETGQAYTVLIDDHASIPRICWLLYE